MTRLSRVSAVESRRETVKSSMVSLLQSFRKINLDQKDKFGS
jgi:hypothetical protein